jgi:hypothetical protein
MQLKSFENFSDPAPLRSLVNARQAVITQTGPGVLNCRAVLPLCGATAL